MMNGCDDFTFGGFMGTGIDKELELAGGISNRSNVNKGLAVLKFGSDVEATLTVPKLELIVVDLTEVEVEVVHVAGITAGEMVDATLTNPTLEFTLVSFIVTAPI
jgi:hypothetical protein